MRKTLVFYKGRAPNGLKTDWIIHEYRLQSSENEPTQEEGWVVCRAFRKASSNQRPNHSNFGHDNNYCENTNYMPCSFHCDVEDEYKKSIVLDQLLQIPQLESPCDLSSSLWCNSVGSNVENNIGCAEEIGNGGHGEVVDWKALDKLLSSSSSKAFLPLNYDAGGGNFHEEDYFIN
ncbi:hypothetical protein Cni_G12272 [Canna indica]|uniref:NAC domain-containing protein n=1 Tax=Canna indica TaxID=4628 RepID=A0AAQ3K7V6_9LILI|nr:hypothetical protein Cni_G12272 [Canna indica]